MKRGLIAAIPAISLQAALFVLAVVVPQDTCVTLACIHQLTSALTDFGVVMTITTVGYFVNGFLKGDS